MSTVLLRVIDLETAGMDPADSIVEAGWTDVFFDTEKRECAIGRPSSLLFRPTKPMPADVIAVHHLTMQRLKDLPPCTEDDLRLLVTDGAPDFLVAHQKDFEAQWLTLEITGELRWACTFKASLRAWEEAPGHGLSVLRYWRGLDLPDELAMPPHRAGPDSYVGAHILGELLKTETVNDLVRWTREPRHYPTCPLHKFKGRPWTEVDHSYLKWITGGANDLEFDLKFAAQTELNRRAEMGAGT